MTTAAAEPTDAEIERLLDRANLPEVRARIGRFPDRRVG